MTAEELTRVKELVKRSDSLQREIQRLGEAIKVGKEASMIKFVFSPFGIWHSQGTNPEQGACCSDILKDLSAEFRDAFVALVEQRLGERTREYEELKI